MENYNLYVRDKELWEEFLSKERYCGTLPSVKIVENGTIIPAKKTGEAINGIYSGGVIDENDEFVAGFLRMREARKANFTCYGSYDYDKSTLTESDEEVIFGGMVIPIFGHFFTECLNRLWYVLEKEDTKTKIAFLTLGDADFYDDFFALAGIKKERIIYITAPTKFRKIIVPDQSVYLRDCYTEKADIVYKKIRENAPKKDCDKLYLSRSKYSDTMMGEEFFEKFYKKQGYTVIHPETLPITEQIAYVSSAKEIVATIGTLSHFVVFAEKGAHLTTLLRSNEIKAHNAQSVINAFKEIRSDIVDVDMHLLPIRHTSGIFLILPNSHFKDYLKANSITFEEEDFSYNLGDYMLPYYKRWLSRYTEQNRYDHLISFDISDVISTVSALVDDKSFPREKLDQTERRNKLIKDNKKLREIKENQKSKYENLREKYLALKESNKELNDKYERLVEKSDALEKDLREARADLNATKMELEAEKNKGFFKKHKKS